MLVGVQHPQQQQGQLPPQPPASTVSRLPVQPPASMTYQNMCDNHISMAGGSSSYAAYCEPSAHSQHQQASAVPAAPEPGSGGSVHQVAVPPVLNLAKVSRNNESQTTPRRAADAAFHNQLQQQQYAAQHQGKAAAEPAGVGPRVINVDATTEGISLRGPDLPHGQRAPNSRLPAGSYRPPGMSAAANPGRGGQQGGGAAVTVQAQAPSRSSAASASQYQHQARYVVPAQQQHMSSWASPRGGPEAPVAAGAAPSAASAGLARGFVQRLPAFLGGISSSSGSGRRGSGGAPNSARSSQAPAAVPPHGSARHASLDPYLQALPSASTWPHQQTVGATPAAQPAAQPASGAVGTFSLPPLHLAPASARGVSGTCQAASRPLQPDRAERISQQPALGSGSQVQPLGSSRGQSGGPRDDVYARLSQGLPSIETSRSARMQAARPPHAPQQQHSLFGLPQQSQEAAAGGNSPRYAASFQRQHSTRSTQLANGGYGGRQVLTDSLSGSTGLTPRTANLMAHSPRSPLYASGSQQQQQQQPKAAVYAPSLLRRGQAHPMAEAGVEVAAPKAQAAPQPPQHMQQQVVQPQQQLAPQQQFYAASGQPVDAGHLYAAYSGRQLQGYGQRPAAGQQQQQATAQYAMPAGQLGASQQQQYRQQQQQYHHQLQLPPQPQQQQQQQAAMGNSMQLPQPPLHSSGTITSQFAKLHSGGSFEAGSYQSSAAPIGASPYKFGSLQQPGISDPDAIRAVRQQPQQPVQPQQQRRSSYDGTAGAVTAPTQPNNIMASGFIQYTQTHSEAATPGSYAMPPQGAASQQLVQPLLPGLPFVEQTLAAGGAADQMGLQPMEANMQQQDLDLVAAVSEEIAVYDLERQMELERQQQAAAVAAASRRVSHVAAEGLALPAAAAGGAGSSARRLSFPALEGFGSQLPTAAAGTPLHAHPSPTIARPSGGSSAEGSRPASCAAVQRVQQLQKEQEPTTAAAALRQWGHVLTPYEQSEVLSFPHVWFVGKPNAPKIKGEKMKGEPNCGYDDSRGDYITVAGDHIAYRYEVVGVLGRGSFGQVLRCVDHRSGAPVALKIIRNKKRFQKQAAVEAAILALLREQARRQGWGFCIAGPPSSGSGDSDPDDAVNIVRTHESFTFRGHLCITFELLSINLYEYIKACNFQGSSLSVIRRVAQQVLVTLRFLLRLNIVHCDLKPENILLRERGKTSIKVIDFGSSCYADKRMYTYIQSRFYRSPEVILGLPYGPPIDMWSLGCILAELLTGQPIFPGEDEREQLSCIMELLGPPPRALVEAAPRANMFFDTGTCAPLVCPPNSRGKSHRPSSRTVERALGGCDDAAFLDFLQRCLQWEPDRRLTPDQALQHQWIAGNAVSLTSPG